MSHPISCVCEDCVEDANMNCQCAEPKGDWMCDMCERYIG